MGSKVNPIGLRIGINKTWSSKWYADRRTFAKTLLNDFKLRAYLEKTLNDAGLSTIEIARNANQVTVTIHTSRPGVVIGTQGSAIEKLKKDLEAKFKEKFNLSIKEIKKPYLDARVVGELVGKQVEKRIPYRRACKMIIERAMEQGAQGIKIRCSGRLNGVEIARSEFFTAGKVPLHTLRSDIDFAYFRAMTTYGTIGVRVWIYRGQVFSK